MKFNFGMIRDAGKVAYKFAEKNAPTIFTVIGVSLTVAATIKAIVEAPKAKEEIDVLDEDEEVSHKEYNKAKAKIIAKRYWSVAAMEIGGVGLIFWGHKISLGRTAAAIAAYQMSKDDLKKLENKIVEMDGEKHLRKAKEDILKDEVETSMLTDDSVFNTGKGSMLCYDAIGKRKFISDLEFIRQQTAQLNFDLAEQMKKGKYAVASYNDWCEYIGLEPLDGKIDGNKMAPNLGKDLGWRNRLVKLKITSILLPGDEHCNVIGFEESGAPTWDIDISDDYGNYDDGDDDSSDMKWR